MLHAVQIFYILPSLGKSKYISCTVLYLMILMLFYNFIIYWVLITITMTLIEP